MGCCKDEGGDPLWCERRAARKWHCLEAQKITDVVTILQQNGEWQERVYQDTELTAS